MKRRSVFIGVVLPAAVTAFPAAGMSAGKQAAGKEAAPSSFHSGVRRIHISPIPPFGFEAPAGCTRVD